jgi:hypothetical protein
MLLSWEDMSKHDQLASIHYDLYKDVYGIRPRWINYDSLTETELEVELETLQTEGERIWKEEKAKQEKNLAKVECTIENLIKLGAGDRTTALRWLMDAHGANDDLEYLCYLLDVPYGSFNA